MMHIKEFSKHKEIERTGMEKKLISYINFSVVEV